MIETSAPPLADSAARIAALDTKRSFLVQAPAGSGKTELLTRRFLKLLAQVDEPEQVLAITFTRAATAEMRARVLQALQDARNGSQSAGHEAGALSSLAADALRNDIQRGWRLAEQPQRLNIQTIDSLSLAIAHRTPLLSRLGGTLTPSDRAEALYALAARRTLARLGGDRLEISGAIRALLSMRGVSLKECEKLIADMLAKRALWGQILPLAGTPRWREVRKEFEAPFRKTRARLVKQARNLVAREAGVWDDLLELIAYACGNLENTHPSAPLLGLKKVRRIEDLLEAEDWGCLCDLFLTQGNGWRKAPNKNDGFLAGKEETAKKMKARFAALIATLEGREGALDLLCELRCPPPAEYTDEQWEILEKILLILHYAAAELRLIFAERGEVDFPELGIAARQALSGDENGGDLVHPWRHLLVDEFQDTSQAQYDLLARLVEPWDPASGNTCFLVGDPMQSIYGFRQAEVELFEKTRVNGLGPHLRLTSLILQTNFRSHAGLVDPLNRIFSRIFESGRSGEGYRVEFAPSVASEAAPDGEDSVCVLAQFPPSSPAGPPPASESSAIVKEIVKALERRGEERVSIAVLARAKNHLTSIARDLRRANILYRAVEIEELGARQEILDLLALTRALLHPMDRIAWLSVLRAPWCGLQLPDLHILCGSDDPQLRSAPVLQLLRMRAPLLSADGRQRAERAAGVLESAVSGRQRAPLFSLWVERVWRSLGGRQCVDRAAYENVLACFDLLRDVAPDASDLCERVQKLCAQPDPAASERSGVQLMTIHKAKGLGFDIVFVPSLHRRPRRDTRRLLTWLERAIPDLHIQQSEIIFAPIGRRGEDSAPLTLWIERQLRLKDRLEEKRLLYVAATRARSQLYFSGAPILGLKSGEESMQPPKPTLLETAWPGLEDAFLELRKREFSDEFTGNLTEPVEPGSSASQARRGRKETGLLRRISANWSCPAAAVGDLSETESASGRTTVILRPEGSLKTRALGVAAHALLEELAGLLLKTDAIVLQDQVRSWGGRAEAVLRHAGLSGADAKIQSARVVSVLKCALEDEIGRWILSAHEEAETEASWSLLGPQQEGELHTLRGDRTFLAGAEPLLQGRTHAWIVDYKTTSHSPEGLEAFLDSERERYRPQLEAYGAALRQVRGDTLPLRLALYYPLLKRFEIVTVMEGEAPIRPF